MLNVGPPFNATGLNVRLFRRSHLRGCLGVWNGGCAGALGPYSSHYPACRFHWRPSIRSVYRGLELKGFAGNRPVCGLLGQQTY